MRNTDVCLLLVDVLKIHGYKKIHIYITVKVQDNTLIYITNKLNHLIIEYIAFN